MRRVCWGKERRRILPGISPGGKNLAAPLRQSGRKKVRVFHRAGREHPDQIFINGSMLFMANDSAGLSQLRTSTELKTHRILILSLTFYDLCRLIRTLYREGPAIFPVQKHGLIAACFAGLRRGWLCRLFIIRTQEKAHSPFRASPLRTRLPPSSAAATNGLKPARKQRQRSWFSGASIRSSINAPSAERLNG